MGKWEPHPHWLLLWRLERLVYSDFFGSRLEFQKYRNGLVRSYWTLKRAQAAADKLNRRYNK